MTAHTHEHCEHGPEDQIEVIEVMDPYTFGRHQMCFGCGPHNERGLRMRFTKEGEVVRSRLLLGTGHDGPPGILHGGLQAMIADEVAGWTLVGRLGRIGLTTSLQIRYIGSLRLGEEIVAEGRLTNTSDGFATVQVTIKQGERTGAMARATFILADVAKMEEVLQGPLPEGWGRFFGGEVGERSGEGGAEAPDDPEAVA